MLKIIPEVKPESKCKGLYFRGQVYSYLNGLMLATRKSLSLLKRKSCEGCDECGWVLDYLDSEIANDSRVSYIDDIDHMGLYKAEVVMAPMHYYDSHQEIDHIRFVKVDEPAIDKNNVTGVSKDGKCGRWRASIGYNNQSIYLGLHEDFDDAVCARLAAEQCLDMPEGSSAHNYVKRNIQCR